MTMGLWTPPGVIEEETRDIRTLEGEPGNMARQASFTFRHGHKLHRVMVIHDDTASQAEIEDEAAQACEDWSYDLKELGEGEGKHPPTAEEKKEIGRALNDIRSKMIERREKNGVIYRPGSN
jgi:hypothetical protein